MLRRRAQPLGRSARQRVRVGAIEINEAMVSEVAKEFAADFVRCGMNRDNPKSDFVAPPKTPPRPKMVPVRDAETGLERDVAVFLVVDPFARNPVHGHNETYLRPGQGRFDRIVLKVSADLCMPVFEWSEEIRSTLTHEVAHASDPGIPRYRRRAPTDATERCEYYNNPAEVTAFVAQARRDLISFRAVSHGVKLRQKGLLKTPADLLRILSPTYATMYSCLRPKTKRRFLRMAAHVWEDGWYSEETIEEALAREARRKR